MPGAPHLSDDLKELIKLLTSHGVEFLVVGGHAVAYHGRPRFTEDLDLFLRRSNENARRTRLALNEFGFGLTEEAEQQLAESPRAMMILGRKPNQVDLINFLDGVEFDAAWSRRIKANLGDLEVSFLALEDLVATKRAAGRAKDIDDLNRLREIVGGPLPGDPS